LLKAMLDVAHSVFHGRDLSLSGRSFQKSSPAAASPLVIRTPVIGAIATSS
jgi:hypothetical protein